MHASALLALPDSPGTTGECGECVHQLWSMTMKPVYTAVRTCTVLSVGAYLTHTRKYRT